MRTQMYRFGLLVALSLVLGGAAMRPPPGGGGGGGGTGGGTIFYMHAGNSYPWSMNSDGSNAGPIQTGTFGVLSRALHNNQRWFLDARPVPDEYYEDGSQRVEVFVFRYDYDPEVNNSSETRVQLTDDTTLRVQGSALFTMDWTGGDTAVSFLACRWDGPTLVESGIYTAPLAFGEDGNIVGLAAQPATAAIPFPPGFTLHSFSCHPAGTKIVYGNETGLWIADSDGSPHYQIFSGSARTPQWSPDGGKIVFGSNGNIFTIKSNGTQLRQILARNTVWNYDKPYWSPTGSNIVCYATPRPGQPFNFELFRCTATGGSVTNLSNTADNGSGNISEWCEITLGWR